MQVTGQRGTYSKRQLHALRENVQVSGRVIQKLLRVLRLGPNKKGACLVHAVHNFGK